MEEKDYERFEKEYEDFKKEMLSKSKEEIYGSFYKIRFYENMNDFIFSLKEIKTVIYGARTAEKVLSKYTLEELYDIFIDMEEVSIGGYAKIIEFLEIVEENMEE